MTQDNQNAEQTVKHGLAGGSAGGPGENSAECLCGVTYDGFDSHAEATALLDQHIERATDDYDIGEASTAQAALDEAVADAEPPLVDDKRAAFCAGLEQIAAFLRAHPDVPLPYISSTQAGGGIRPTMEIYLHGDDQREELATIARAMGTAEKIPYDSLARLNLVREFAGIALVAVADRDKVCERVVVGTREVTKTVPDPEALAAVPTVEVTETVEDVEWVCRPLLADTAAGVR